MKTPQLEPETLVDRRVFLTLVTGTVGVYATLQASILIQDAAEAREWERTLVDESGEPNRVLARAWSRARGRGVPLVVLLDDSMERAADAAWAAYLDNASDSAHAHLALCEVAYASSEQVRLFAPDARWQGAADETRTLPGALVARVGDDPVRRIEAVDTALGWSEFVLKDLPEGAETWQREMETRLNAAIAPDGASFVRAAQRELGTNADDLTQLTRALAERSRARLARAAPPGAKWSKRGYGCDEQHFEDGTHGQTAYACGMGFAPAPSRHFLWLYTTDRR